MQISATRHSSRISTESTASLVSFGTGSGVLAVATCTDGVSGGSICDESGNVASTIDSGSSEAAVVSVLVTNSAAIATSASPIAALPIAVDGGSYAGPKSAMRIGAWRSTIDIAVSWMPAELKASQ